jgi:hypothetical protein
MQIVATDVEKGHRDPQRSPEGHREKKKTLWFSALLCVLKNQMGAFCVKPARINGQFAVIPAKFGVNHA